MNQWIGILTSKVACSTPQPPFESLAMHGVYKPQLHLFLGHRKHARGCNGHQLGHLLFGIKLHFFEAPSSDRQKNDSTQRAAQIRGGRHADGRHPSLFLSLSPSPPPDGSRLGGSSSPTQSPTCIQWNET